LSLLDGMVGSEGGEEVGEEGTVGRHFDERIGRLDIKVEVWQFRRPAI